MTPIAFRVKATFLCKALCDVALLMWPYFSPSPSWVFHECWKHKAVVPPSTSWILLRYSVFLIPLLHVYCPSHLGISSNINFSKNPSLTIHRVCPSGTLGIVFLTFCYTYLGLSSPSDGKLLEDQNAIFLMIVSHTWLTTYHNKNWSYSAFIYYIWTN